MFQRIPGNIEQHSGECSRRFWGMFQRISENVEQDSEGCSREFRGIFHKIAGNFRKNSGECSKRFGGIFKKILENAAEEPGECSRRFRGMMNKILRNVGKDSRKYSKIESKDIYSSIIKNVCKSLSKQHMWKSMCKYNNLCVSIITYFILLRHNQPVCKALTMIL